MQNASGAKLAITGVVSVVDPPANNCLRTLQSWHPSHWLPPAEVDARSSHSSNALAVTPSPQTPLVQLPFRQIWLAPQPVPLLTFV